MARPSKTQALSVWMNGERVGTWFTAANNVQDFRYADEWLVSPETRPISLSMPVGPPGTTYKGAVVERFFENLLPDSKEIRDRIRQRFQAKSARAFDLLTEIGRDCIGAIQLMPADQAPPNTQKIEGDALTEKEIAQLLSNTLSAPTLGRIDHDEDFRISLSGAQEKTALLRYADKWMRPHGPTPTTHILKLPIGEGNQGIDLRTSVENEWLCAQILRAYGVDTADCWMDQFGPHKVLGVERFDRRLAKNERWFVRLPQEDLCQATGTDRDHKYEADGGPGIQKTMDLLLGSARADQDRVYFFRTQILFWMLCAIDGHAKNFSLFLEAGGQFRLTPRYDVLSAFPVLGNRAGQLSPHKVKMAMAVQGEGRRHYNWNSIQPRHWAEMARRCGLAKQIDSLMEDLAAQTPKAIDIVASQLPKKFPSSVAGPILDGIRQSAAKLAV
jgi:serine/threonine-protein kinase HipA